MQPLHSSSSQGSASLGSAYVYTSVEVFRFCVHRGVFYHEMRNNAAAVQQQEKEMYEGVVGCSAHAGLPRRKNHNERTRRALYISL